MRREYYEWIKKLVHSDGRYNKLLEYLYSTDFYYTIPMDYNRAEDGLDLRYRFCYINGYDYKLIDEVLKVKQCSILEMMVALAVRCEEDIMATPNDDRTSLWFWTMIDSLGLSGMDDFSFDDMYVDGIIDDFLARRYLPNGHGGLFTLHNCPHDLRDVEIHYQMCWFLEEYEEI
jgi:hypothetical protein